MSIRALGLCALLSAYAAAAAAQAPAGTARPRVVCPDQKHVHRREQCSALTMTATSSGSAVAEMYTTQLKTAQQVTPGGEAPFGESINLYTGEVAFSQTDIRVPGIGPDIVLTRFNNALSAWLVPMPLPFGSWNASIPHIELLVTTPGPAAHQAGRVGTNWTTISEAGVDTTRCSAFMQTAASWEPWWSGIQFVDEHGTPRELLGRAAGNTAAPTLQVGGQAIAFPIVTQDHWQIGCLPRTANGEQGEAFLAVSPEGVKYWLDHAVGYRAVPYQESDPAGGPKPIHFGRMLARMLVTRIEDRFGNALTYSYSADRLQSIDASDGRRVTLSWRADSPVISTVVVAGTSPRTWSYSYASPSSTGARLTAVTLPDGSGWSFDNIPVVGGQSPYGETTAGVPWTDCDIVGSMREDPALQTGTIRSPAGLTGTFTRKLVFHSRSYVPSACLQFNQDPRYEAVPSIFGSQALVSRSMSGPGVPTATWTYDYSSPAGSFTRSACAATGTCVATATTTVTTPDNHRTVLTHDTRWGAWEGKLLLEQVYEQGSNLVRTTRHAYAAANGGPYPTRLGHALVTTGATNSDRQETLTPLLRREVVQQGRLFSWEVNACGTTPCYDAFARPVKATRASAPAP